MGGEETLLIYLSALAALLTPGQTDGPAGPALRFEKHAELDCDWVMRGPAREGVRGSISRGEQSPVLHIVDPLFNSWSEVSDPVIALSAGASGRRVEALGYVIHSREAGSSLGIFLNEKVRSIVGGARQLQIWKDGKLVLNLALANTPSANELAACVSEGD